MEIQYEQREEWDQTEDNKVGRTKVDQMSLLPKSATYTKPHKLKTVTLNTDNALYKVLNVKWQKSDTVRKDDSI